MLAQALFEFTTNPLKLGITLVSIVLAVYAFQRWRKSGNIWLLYSHIFLLALPLLVFTFSMQCGMGLISGLLQFCAMVVTKLLLYFIPAAIILTIIICYFVAPRLYKRAYKAREIKNSSLSSLAKKLGVKTRIYLLDIAKPIAFSFKKEIFISVGMFDLLSRKELEAVMLHELCHVKNQSSLSKFSLFLTKTFSPFSAFGAIDSLISGEERKADLFAIRTQGTRSYLNSAKKKVNKFRLA